MERRKRTRVELQQSHAISISIIMYNNLYPPTPKSRSWLSQLLSHINRVCMHQQPISKMKTRDNHPNSVTHVRKQTLQLYTL